jgi:lipoate-protein ligase A
MKYIDLTLPTPQANLACDEALLDLCEEGYEHEILRFWEHPEHFVVLGFSNKTSTEIHLQSARAGKIPITRRCSGGGTVLQGPGCLNFSLILKIPESGPLASITKTNEHIMNRHRDALKALDGFGVEVQGFSDLTTGNLKFSGNAQRRKQRCLLFHGTFLLDFDIPWIEKLLPLPSRQPPYRRNRSHGDFLTNLRAPGRRIKEALRQTWGAAEPLKDIPLERIERLAQLKYNSDEWTYRF